MELETVCTPLELMFVSFPFDAELSIHILFNFSLAKFVNMSTRSELQLACGLQYIDHCLRAVSFTNRIMSIPLLLNDIQNNFQISHNCMYVYVCARSCYTTVKVNKRL
jgi:hypothetical protein